MPYTRPSLSTLINETEAQIDARLGTAQARLPASNLSVLARVIAGGEHGLYGYIDWISKQILPDTADDDMLDRHGSIWGIHRKLATKASGSVTVTGSSGAVLPLGSTLQRADGAEFTTTQAAIIASDGSRSVPVRAVVAGTAGNTDADTTLTLPSTPAGISSAITVESAGLNGGIDGESDNSLRARILARIRQAPHGGAAFDYVTWALEIEGVTRAWVNPGYLGPHTISVTFLCEDRSDIIPTQADVAAVTAHIEQNRPVTATEVSVFAPAPLPLNLTISLVPGTDTVKLAVLDALAEFMTREGLPGASIPISRIREAISGAVGETDHELVSPTSALHAAFGQIPVLGTVTWA